MTEDKTIRDSITIEASKYDEKCQNCGTPITSAYRLVQYCQGVSGPCFMRIGVCCFDLFKGE